MANPMKKPGSQDKSNRGGGAARSGKLDYRIIFDAAGNAMAFTEVDSGKIIDVNTAWQATTGFARAEVLGKTALEIGLWADPARRAACIEALRKTGTVVDFEASLILNSVEVPQRISARVVDANRGKCIFWEFRNVAGQKRSEQQVQALLSKSEQSRRSLLSMLQDVKRAEEALRESQALYHSLVEQLPAGVFRKDQEGCYVFVNETFCQLRGIAANEVLGKTPLEFQAYAESGQFTASRKARMRPELAEQGTHDHELILKTGRTIVADEKWIGLDGQTLYLHVVKTPVYSHDGRIIGSQGIQFDVTERKRAETELKLVLTGLNQLGVGIFRALPDGRIISVNDGACRNLGYTRDELCRMSIPDIDPTFDRKQWEAHRQELKACGTRTFEGVHRRKDGTTYPVEVTVSYMESEGQEHSISFARDITERRRADEALTMSEVRYRRLFEAARDGILILDAETGMIVDVNPFLIEMLGYSRGLFLEKKIWELGFFKDIIANKDTFAELQRKEYVRYENLPLETAEGRKFEVEFVSNVYSVNHHKVIQCNIRDITERKRAEAALLESEGRFRQMAENINEVIWLANEDLTEILYISPRFEEVWGHSCQNLYENPRVWIDAVHPDDRQRVHDAFVEQRTSGQELSVEYRIVRPDGSIRWICDNGFPIRDASGKIYRIAGVAEDITERKLAGEKLRLRESFLSAITENQPGLLWLKDTEGRFLMVNKAFAAACGRGAPEHVQGLTDLDIWPKELADKYRHDDQQVMAAGNAIMVEEMILIGNSHVWFETFKTPVRDDKGCVIGTTGFARDITERKRVEERIREQAALLDAANDAILVRTLEHIVTYWNDGAERLYGWTRAEALGRKFTDVLEPAAREAFEAAHAALLEQGHWSGELKMTSRTGKAFIAFCRWTMLRDDQGRPREILAINTDITERKQLEANFLRAQRMEGIGALAGGIAHDLNNILQPILITGPLLRETISDPESRSLLDTVENSAQRGADIIKQLLTFARGTPEVRVPLPVRHLMGDMDKIIRETFPRNIKLTVDAPKDLWPVLGDATQIHQALMNLCVNARDAMPNGGVLTLAAKNLTLDETFAAVMPEARPGTYVCVSVTDTGTGIPPEHLDRIFDPFFTTKEIGKGTGLGLATVLGIVRGHGGFVRVNSHVGSGTTFELYLPASPREKAAEKTDQENLPPEMHGELILVVDDETAVRRVIQRTLDKHGYRVVTAAEGSEAMAFFAQHRAEIKAVITDLMMPGMDGPALIRALRHMDPRLPILSMTGMGEQADIKGIQSLGLPVLLKPFVRGELLAALHQAIAAAAVPARTAK
jgi:PAS domain S-box-containing protein